MSTSTMRRSIRKAARRRVLMVPLVTALVGLASLGAATWCVDGLPAARAQEPNPPHSSVLRPTGGTRLVARAQEQSSAGARLTVTGYGQATAPAETARLQFLVVAGPNAASAAGMAGDTAAATPSAEGGASPPLPAAEPHRLTVEALSPVVQAIAAAGVPAANIQVVVSPAFANPGSGAVGGDAGRIDLHIDGPTLEAVNGIVTATGDATRASGLVLAGVGVGYDVADCRALRRQAQAQAVADANAQAQDLADLLGVPLGKVIEASEFSYSPGPPSAGGCAPAEAGAGGGGSGVGLTLVPFDPTAPAVAQVTSQLSVTYAAG